MNTAADTLVGVWSALRKRFEAAGIDSPVLDARMLIEAGAGVARIEIITDPHRVLTIQQRDAIEELALRRLAREPMSHIVGRKGFWKFELQVGPSVLTPRPETETLIDLVIEQIPPHQGGDVLDLGVGSGAILFAILSERAGFMGVGLDSSLGAIAVAQANAAALSLSGRARFVHGEWEAADGLFDLIVSNPPYIPSGEIARLMPEVAQFEPHAALDGGPDGLDAYRRIAAVIAAQLRPGGLFVLEVGAGQDVAVIEIMRRAGLELGPARADLSGVARVVWGRKGA